MHSRKRDCDGKLHIACIYYTSPCLQREVFAGSPRCRISLGHLSHLGYPQVSPGWPWLLPGVMEPGSDSHIHQGHVEERSSVSRVCVFE